MACGLPPSPPNCKPVMEVRSGGGGICEQGLRRSSQDAARALRSCPIDALHQIDEELHPKRQLLFQGIVHQSHVYLKDLSPRLFQMVVYFQMNSSSRLAISSISTVWRCKSGVLTTSRDSLWLNHWRSAGIRLWSKVERFQRCCT